MTGKHMVRINIALLICGLVILGNAYHSSADTFAYDGKWWLSVDKARREGFVDGYIACYMGDVKGKIKFDHTGQSYAPRVTDYLDNHSQEQDRSVEELLWKMTTPPFAPPARRYKGTAAGGPTGKYGIDAQFWREIRPSKRLGVVEGFLYCYSKYETGSRGTFSKAPPWYAEAISNWYGVDDKTDTINKERVNVEIPVVLFKFRDSETP